MSDLESLKRTYVDLLTASGIKGVMAARVETDLSLLNPCHDPAEYLRECTHCIILHPLGECC